jgi:hypothetical protein
MSSDQKSLEEVLRELPPDSQAKIRKPLEEIMDELPPDIQVAILRILNAFSVQNNNKPKRKLRQTWAGGLSDYRDQYTSLELQKKALEWRGD